MATSPGRSRFNRELALFAGIGGGCLGSQILGWQTVGYVEKDDFCQQVLQRRIRGGWLDDAPIWDDAKTFDGRPWRGKVDIVTAGFPCQPFSVAGDGEPREDARNLWPTTARILREVRPRVAFLENVPGLRSGTHGYFNRILGDLAEIGFDVVWGQFQATHSGARHTRKRLWILAVNRWKEVVLAGECKDRGGWKKCRVCGNRYAECLCPGPTQDGIEYREFDGTLFGRPDLADSIGQRRQKQYPSSLPERLGSHSWETSKNGACTRFRDESRPTGVVDGTSDRLDRIKSVGNAQSPQQMALAWEILSGKMLRVLEVPIDVEYPRSIEDRRLDVLGFDSRQREKAREELDLRTVLDVIWFVYEGGDLEDIPYVGPKTRYEAIKRIRESGIKI